ncbi:MFS transporter [Paramicrobacterium chengjingii]|uniref:MFS transporter n=1 Tax=Paramicrobacterium chengjingii TaxID=2769067 RepID=UPI00141F2EF8|nr:MFS transporter [Microbacterium chengjingii]
MSLTKSAQTRATPLVVVMFLAIAAFQVAATMIFPALPTVAADLGASQSDLSLSQSLFFAVGGVAAASLPLSDRVGRRTMLLAVIILGVVGSVLIATTSMLPLYNLGRWMQAPGVIALPLSFLILRDHVAEDRYSVILGWLSALNLGATGIDGIVGGWVTDNIGYNGIFWISAVVGVLALVGVLLVIPLGNPKRADSFDWPGLVILAIAMLCISIGLGQAGSEGWTSPSTLGLLIGGLALLAVFILIERAIMHPIIEVRHLANRHVFTVPIVVLFGLAGFFSVFSILAPFWLQLPSEAGGGGLSATTYALFTVPGTIVSFFLAPLCGVIARRTGWRPVLLIGVAISLFALIGMTVSLRSTIATLIFFGLLAAVFGGAAVTAANGLGVLRSPRESPAFLPGINAIMFSFGSSLGSALVGSLIAKPTLESFVSAFAVAAALMLIALAFVFLMPRRNDSGDANTTTNATAGAAS